MLVIVLGASAVVLRGFALLIAHATAAKPAIETDRIPVAAGSAPPAFVRRTFFFSASERSFYEALCRLAPEHTVFAKVRLSDLVRVQASGREFWERFKSISSKHVDFVLCDEQLAPVVAIELEDTSPLSAKRRIPDRVLEAVLESAALPIVRVPAQRGYENDEIRQLLAPHLRLNACAVAELMPTSYIPARSWQPNI